MNNFVICCGYKGCSIKEYFARYFFQQISLLTPPGGSTHVLWQMKQQLLAACHGIVDSSSLKLASAMQREAGDVREFLLCWPLKTFDITEHWK
jgi:hypothetical protein